MSSLELKIEARRSAAITTENANKYFLVLEFIYLKSRAEKISIAIKIEDGANRPILPVIAAAVEKLGIKWEELPANYKAVVKAAAEAAKVIENSQRDINIAFVNELAKIFNLMNIDTHAVLEAAILHAPSGLHVIVVSLSDDWRWVRWLPHVRPAPRHSHR